MLNHNNLQKILVGRGVQPTRKLLAPARGPTIGVKTVENTKNVKTNFKTLYLFNKKFEHVDWVQDGKPKCGPIFGYVYEGSRSTQLTTRYAHHILSLFDIFSCS